MPRRKSVPSGRKRRNPNRKTRPAVGKQAAPKTNTVRGRRAKGKPPSEGNSRQAGIDAAPATARPKTAFPKTGSAEITLTLALGGGGARGVAHLGVIESLLDADMRIERVVGVSIGSLAGAIYAFNPDIRGAIKHTLAYLLSPEFQKHQKTLFGASPKPGEATTGGYFSWYDRVARYLRGHRIFRRFVTGPSLLPGIVLQDVVDALLPDADISEAKIPLSIVAVDLRSGHRVLLEKGRLRDAVRASSALPGIFPPVEIDQMLLCDVGVLYSLPTTESRSYPSHCLVAVDVSSSLRPLPHCDSAFDVMVRMDEIGEAMFRKHVREVADVVIRPSVSDVEWFDFSRCEKLVAAGRAAGREQARAIREICRA